MAYLFARRSIIPAMIEGELNAARLTETLQSAGVKVLTTVVGEVWRIHAIDANGQIFKLSGEDLYEVLIVLAEQVGVEWE